MAETASKPSAARQRIDAFLATLSVYDLISLRNRFRSDQIPLMGLASLPDLPVEILCLVVPWLSLDDVLSCLLVNRAWFSSWSQGAVMTAIGRFFFPGLIEKQKQLHSGQSARDLVHSSLIRSLRRQRGQPHRVSFISWNEFYCPVFHRFYKKENDNPNGFISDIKEGVSEHHGNREAGDGVRPVLYSRVFYDKGRLAWQPSRTSIIIADLRTCERRDCNLMEMYLQAQWLLLHAMSHELLVFVVNHIPDWKTLHIWHIDLQAWKRVALPGPLVKCFLEGDRAAFVTRQGSVIAWSWSNGATEIDVSRAMSLPPVDHERAGTLPAVILHPNMTDTLYIASLYLGKRNGRNELNSSEPSRVEARPSLMSVVRYEDGQPVEELHKRIDTYWTYDDLVCDWMTDGLLCSKLGSNGLYNLGGDHPKFDFDDQYTPNLPVVGFNIYTESFAQHMCEEYSSNFAWGYSQAKFDPWRTLSRNDETAAYANRRRCLARVVRMKLELTEAHVPSYSREVTGYGPSQDWGPMCADDDFEIYLSANGVLVFSFTRDTTLPSIEDTMPRGTEGGL